MTWLQIAMIQAVVHQDRCMEAEDMGLKVLKMLKSKKLWVDHTDALESTNALASTYRGQVTQRRPRS